MSAILSLTGIVMSADGTYSTAETPLDSASHACWNAGTVFDHTKTCASQGLAVAQ